MRRVIGGGRGRDWKMVDGGCRGGGEGGGGGESRVRVRGSQSRMRVWRGESRVRIQRLGLDESASASAATRTPAH